MMLKRIFFAGFWTLFSFSVYAQNSGIDSTQIEAYLEGVPAGVAKLVGVWGDQNYLADSAIVDDKGHFVLRRKNLLPSGFYTLLLPGMKNLSFIVDKDQRMTIRANIADVVGSISVEGSINTELFYQTTRQQMQFESELTQLASLLNKTNAATPEHQAARKRQTEVIEARKNYLGGIFKQYPDAFFTKFKIAGQNPEFIDFRKPNGDADTIRQVVYFREHF